MKFGRTFRNALEADRYPRHWVEKAITYRQLKKILGKVREELLRNGYDPDTLHRLRASHHAEYRLEPDGSRLLRPKLVVRPGRRTGGPSSLEHATAARPSADSPSPAPDSADGGAPGSRDSNNSNGRDKPDDDGWVMIPLRSDAKFFSVLQSDVSELDSLQEEERQSMHAKIRDLGTGISALARPRRGFVRLSKSDLYRWREIFELYLAAEVFFSTSEASGGPRDSETAQKQLIWFQEEVNKRQLPQHFKIEASAVAYSQFLALNATLLHNLRFQELNQTAVTKIIKKFDKRTSLGVKATFPKVMYSAQFISESISKDICAQLSREVVSIVPQIVDYTCTVCLSICWLPVRLDCNHVFCIRCMIMMQNRNKRSCPLCRAEVIQRATEINIDGKLVRFLERWFPKEIKEKQSYNEIERRKELLGDILMDDCPSPCLVM